MANICSLLLRPLFTGRTYHDLQLDFDFPLTNCTIHSEQIPLLIQFTRMYNSTLNRSSYITYDLANVDDTSPHFQVFHNDHINLCVRSALSSDSHYESCYEFYMITMLSTTNTTLWPLLIIFGYVFVLILAMLFSLFAQIFEKFTKTFFSGSITKKLIKNRNFRSFLPIIQRHEQTDHLKKIDEKKNFLRTVDLIVKECQPNRNSFIISTDQGHSNRAYL
ncbi:hypothetical protein I4U23_013757 [Adineta vaga]|nr:hypothetical protein I4U23_013757 [Adineta vaga]